MKNQCYGVTVPNRQTKGKEGQELQGRKMQRRYDEGVRYAEDASEISPKNNGNKIETKQKQNRNITEKHPMTGTGKTEFTN